MEKITSVKEFQTEVLKDLYNAEVLTVTELLYFKNLAERPDLKGLIQDYLYSCRSHITALEELLDDGNTPYFEDHCRTMKSLIRESKKLVEQCGNETVRELAIITALQRISTCKKTAYKSLLNSGAKTPEKKYQTRMKEIIQREYDMEVALENMIADNINLKVPAS